MENSATFTTRVPFFPTWRKYRGPIPAQGIRTIPAMRYVHPANCNGEERYSRAILVGTKVEAHSKQVTIARKGVEKSIFFIVPMFFHHKTPGGGCRS